MFQNSEQKRKKPSVWASGRRSWEWNKPVVPSPRRKGRRGTSPHLPPSPQPAGLRSGYLQGLSRLALYPVLRRAGSNNQTLDSIPEYSGFQIDHLESKITRKPHFSS